MAEKLLKYRVKAGRTFGAFSEHASGSIVELTEAEASGFLDKLELVRDAKAPEPPASEEEARAHLQALTVGQLQRQPEYESLPAPKPIKKADLVDAILWVRMGRKAES